MRLLLLLYFLATRWRKLVDREMPIVLGCQESYVKRNKFILKTAHCTRGLFLALIATSSNTDIAELSIWVHSSGFVNVASMPLRRGSSIDVDSRAVDIVWSPWGDRICIVYANEITIVRLKFEMVSSQQEISYDDAVMYVAKIDESTIVNEAMSTKIFPIKRISPKRFLLGNPTSAVLSDMGRYVLVGSESSVLKKLSWNGDIVSEVQCPASVDTITMYPRKTIFENSERLPQSNEPDTQNRYLIDDMKIGSDDRASPRPSFFICGWSERLRISAAVVSDGSFVLLRSLQVIGDILVLLLFSDAHHSLSLSLLFFLCNVCLIGRISTLAHRCSGLTSLNQCL